MGSDLVPVDARREAVAEVAEVNVLMSLSMAMAALTLTLRADGSGADVTTESGARSVDAGREARRSSLIVREGAAAQAAPCPLCRRLASRRT